MVRGKDIARRVARGSTRRARARAAIASRSRSISRVSTLTTNRARAGCLAPYDGAQVAQVPREHPPTRVSGFQQREEEGFQRRSGDAGILRLRRRRLERFASAQVRVFGTSRLASDVNVLHANVGRNRQPHWVIIIAFRHAAVVLYIKHECFWFAQPTDSAEL